MRTKTILFSMALIGIIGFLSSLAACGGTLAAIQTPLVSFTPEALTEIPSITYTPSYTFTRTPFVMHLPTPTFTNSPLPPLNDGSDLLTATPKTFYLDLPYIQIIQDNRVIKPVKGVVKLSYTPFTFRYVTKRGGFQLMNFSFNSSFQNSAQEGLNPFLPCPNPFCEESELPMDRHVITIDDRKVNVMWHCRDAILPDYDHWIWDRCPEYGGGEQWYTSSVREHDVRVFGRYTNKNYETIPVSDLKGISDKVYITAYCTYWINRVDKSVSFIMDQDFELLKLTLQFED